MNRTMAAGRYLTVEMRCHMTKLELLARSLNSPIAERHLGAALRSERVIEGDQLEGDLPEALGRVPASMQFGEHAVAALEVAAATIPDELSALERRQGLSFVGAVSMSVAVVAVGLWVAFDPIADAAMAAKAQLMAPLVPLIGGGALLRYSKHLSAQAKDLRADLVRITRLLRSLAAAEDRKLHGASRRNATQVVRELASR